MASHVVLDMAPHLVRLLTAIIPLSIILLGLLGRPTLRWIVPRRLRQWIAEPTDGLQHEPHLERAKRRLDPKGWILVGAGMGQVGLWGVMTVLGGVRREDEWGFRAIGWFGWVLATLLPLLRPPRTAPYVLLGFYLAHLILLGLNGVNLLLHPHGESVWATEIINGVLLVVLIGTSVTYRLTAVEDDDVKNVEPSVSTDEVDDGQDEITLVSPEDSVTLAQWIIFSWVRPIIRQGERTKLGYRDVWRLPSPMASEGVRRSAALLESGRIIPRIFFSNSLDLILSITLGFTSSFLSYCGPYFLKQILQSLAPASPEQADEANKNLRRSAYVYTGLAFAAQILRAEVDLQQLWHERRAILRCRSELMGRVYEKSLKRRDTSGVVAPKEEEGTERKGKKGKDENKSGGGASTGKIVSLMSMDCNKVANQLMNLSSIVAAPFELVVATLFLYQLLGWTCIAGLSIMAVSLPLNHVLVKRRIKIHRSVLASRDRRMEVLNEFIHAIRFVKYSASEEQWLARVFSARTAELGWLLKTRLNNLMINCIWTFTPDLVMLLAFACYTKIAHHELDVPTAFTSLALFALVRGPMNMLPASITQLLQTYVSIQRLETYLDEPEVEEWVSSLDKEPPKTWTGSEPVQIVKGKFRYQDKTTAASGAPPPSPAKAKLLPPPALSTTAIEVSDDVEEEEKPFELVDINVTFPSGKLSLVAGATGSGKSSIFLALLGEMDRLEGEVKLPKGTRASPIDPETGCYEGVAYAAQLPWLQHASIKNNILFGSKFEERRYKDVIEACALEADLKMFDAGDETEIGEKGISLSGGQRARVALARAVYSRAKTLLLDDPLSAVDSHTARHLFRKCLKGPLVEGRTVILVTHHISLCLPGAEYLVRMSSGRVETQGMVKDLDLSEITTELLEEVEEDPKQDAAVAEEQTKIVDEAAGKLTVKAPVAEAEASAAPDATKKIVGSGGKLIEAEERATGRVKGAVYALYLKAAGYETWIVIVLLIFGGRWFRVADRWWLKIWGESYEHPSSLLVALFLPRPASQPQFSFSGMPVGHEAPHILQLVPHFPSASESVNPYLAVYGLIAVVNLGLMVLGLLAGYHGSFKAARVLFVQTLTRVAHAPFRYYDTTPTGRILNRFSTDFQIIDTSLTDQVRICLTHAFSFIVNVGVIILVSPRFVPPAVLIIYVYVRLSLSYVKCSRDLRRLESNARSPIFSKFGETLAGIVTVRAFGSERRFLDELFSSVDKMLAVNYASAMINRYLLWRFDVLGAVAVAITTLLSLVGGASPGLAALAITSAQSLVQSVYWLCRFVSALEVDLNAVERVTELLNTPQEPPMEIEGKRPPAYWPSDTGGIVVEDLVMSYAPSLPPVIKGVSFEVQPREKVGLVGRTGSGKSTMALSLLRFNDPTSGKIIIDGIDISTIGLRDLRSRITLIPQEAVLFSGTIRSNLDPFDEHSDQDCLDALARVRMIAAPIPPSTRGSREPSRAPSPQLGAAAGPVARLLANETSGVSSDTASITSGSSTTRVENGASGMMHGRQSVSLSTPVSAGGGNFSAGQRQLLALARALLTRSRIIIMDEATASVDFETDQQIQHTIKDEFADSLVLTIAHRLMTVVEYSKVLVLDQGELIEYDTPRALLQREGGSFRAMCEQSPDWDELKAKVGL